MGNVLAPAAVDRTDGDVQTHSFFRLSWVSMLVAFMVVGAPAFAADAYKVGSIVAAFVAKDQFGKPFQLGADCRVLLVSFDMGTGKQANAKLTALGTDYLPKHGAVYVANITGMPAIGRAFALPKMRGYAHRIVLADDAALLAPFPQQDQRVTVLALRGRKVVSVRYWNPASEPVESVVGK